MVWFFLAGFISGFVGEYLFGKWCAEHIELITMEHEEEEDDDKRTGQHPGDMDGSV